MKKSVLNLIARILLYPVIVVACLVMVLFISPIYAAEVKPFISGSIIKVNSTDWLNPDYEIKRYIKPNHAATIKLGVCIKEGDMSLDINLFHLSNPSNGTIGDLKEGDSGINGIEFNVRKEF
jgi:hypothetical protein